MALQPSLGKFWPVPVIVGVLAALSVILAAAFSVPPWPIFISWGLYFIAGARPARLGKEIIGLSGGIAFGFLTLLLMPFFGQIFGDTMGLPVTVGLAAMIIVFLELTNLFELAPAYFMAYAGYFAYVFGGFAGSLDGGIMTAAGAALLPFWALTMVGLGFALTNDYLRKRILAGGPQQTVFDREDVVQ